MKDRFIEKLPEVRGLKACEEHEPHEKSERSLFLQLSRVNYDC
jgi:hypothetical protein